MSSSIIIFGLHAARHAVQQSLDSIETVWIQDNKRDASAIRELLSLLGGVAPNFVPKSELDKLSSFERHQGIVIQKKDDASPTSKDLDDILKETFSTQGILLALDGVQDPHNLGACLRTADAAGVSAVIIPKHNAVSVNATVSHVAAGAAETIPVFQVTNLSRTLRQCQDAGLWVIGTSDQAVDSLYTSDLNRPLVWVLGAEGKGLRENTLKQCDFLVNIPMQGIVESLNVSVATGVCLYETIRQRLLKAANP